MTFLFLSDLYLTDHRLLEAFGKNLKSSGIEAVILPDGRKFAREQSGIALTGTGGLILEAAHLHFIQELTSGIYKSLVSFLSEGMVPSVFFQGHQRKFISFSNNKITFSAEKLRGFMTPGLQVILLSSAWTESGPVYLSPYRVVSEVRTPADSVIFLTEILPPDGIFSFEELRMWSETDPGGSREYSWLGEWNKEIPVSVLNLAGLAGFSSGKHQIITAKG